MEKSRPTRLREVPTLAWVDESHESQRESSREGHTTFIGKPPPVADLQRVRRPDAARIAELRARRRAITAAYEEREKLELLFYEAEAKWAHAFEHLNTTARVGGVVRTRRARYGLRVADGMLWEALRRLLDADARLRGLLARRKRHA